MISPVLIAYSPRLAEYTGYPASGCYSGHNVRRRIVTDCQIPPRFETTRKQAINLSVTASDPANIVAASVF